MRKIEPRLLTQSEAAEYCRMSVPTFKGKCAVRPIMLLGAKAPRYDRHELDKWIDGLRHEGNAVDSLESWLERVGK
jgi:hypothetical protein